MILKEEKNIYSNQKYFNEPQLLTWGSCQIHGKKKKKKKQALWDVFFFQCALRLTYVWFNNKNTIQLKQNIYVEKPPWKPPFS